MAKVGGREKLLQKMKDMPHSVRSAAKQAIAQGADEITDMQRRVAPVGKGKGKKGPGRLRDSIRQTWGGSKAPSYASLSGGVIQGDPDLSVRITAGDTNARHAHLVEFGTKAHTIAAKNFPALGYLGRLGPIVQHGGSKPRPFFFPPYRALKRRVKSRISRAIGKAVRAIAGK